MSWRAELRQLGAFVARSAFALARFATRLTLNSGRAAADAASHPRRTAAAIKTRGAPWARRASWLATAGGLAIGWFYLSFFPHLPDDADLWNANRPTSITLLDRDGRELATRGAVYGEVVALQDLPGYLTTAFIATEDRRFYDHSGYDLRSLARALAANLRSGSVVQGGSTITQQLAKNLYLSSERRMSRKLRELFLSVWLERRVDKDEILSLYLNRIYLGSGAYGVEAASRHYFGKSAREVTLAEAAMLAGLPKAPSSLAPTRNLAGARRRAEVVLDNLSQTDVATPFDLRMARDNPATPIDQPADGELGYFFDYVSALASKLVDRRGRDIVVETTLDRRLQTIAENAVSSTLDANGAARHAGQAALIAFSSDGGVLAMVGGRAYRQSQFNRAVQAKRQPGSAFKPIIYLAALEHGMTPRTRYIDRPVKIDDWEPTNYTDAYLGEVRLAEAMAKSINTVAAQVAQDIGLDAVEEAARRLGVTSKLTLRPALALGASELSLYELTSSYIPFATQGLKSDPFAIRRITDRLGRELYAHEGLAPVRVMTEQHAADMTHMLYQVIYSGSGRSARIGTRPVVGKTGTSQDWRDAWFVGYSGQIVAGVWVGNDDHTPMNKVAGSGLPANIWRAFMGPAHADLPFAELPGAYPAIDWERERRLRRYYRDLGGAFDEIASAGASPGAFRRR